MCIFLVPSPPTGFRISQGVHINDSVVSTFEWNVPLGSSVVDYYKISITPQPLSHPKSNVVFSSPWNVTLHANTMYTASITAGNCVGESNESSTTIGKLCSSVNLCVGCDA